MRNPRLTFVPAAFVLVVCGCRESSDASSGFGAWPPSPVAPVPVAAQPAGTPNWKADATVVSVISGTAVACGWGTSQGQTRSGVTWRITTTADGISLDEDMHNWPTDDVPYAGHLAGAQFTATYSSASNYADFACQFREANISGTFTSDSTFEATETLTWGTPATETTVHRHWTGSRL